MIEEKYNKRYVLIKYLNISLNTLSTLNDYEIDIIYNIIKKK